MILATFDINIINYLMSKWDAFLVICNFRELKSLAKNYILSKISTEMVITDLSFCILENGLIFLAINATVDCVISVCQLDILAIFFLNASASCNCYC